MPSSHGKGSALVLIGMGSLLFVSVVACDQAGVEDGDASPYAAEFAQALANTDSDFVREVLADGVIDQAELEETKDRLKECVASRGVTLSIVTDEYGGTGFHFAGSASVSETQGEALYECQRHGLGDIQTLYDAIRTNPMKQDMDTIIVACLVRHELVPQGFTAEDYVEFLGNRRQVITLKDEGEPEPGFTFTAADNAMERQILPGGVRLDDPQVTHCESNPTW